MSSQSEQVALILTHSVSSALGLDDAQRQKVRAEVNAVLANYVVLPRREEATLSARPSPDELVRRASEQAGKRVMLHGRELRHRR